MTTPHRHVLALACAGLATLAASSLARADNDVALTVYRSDSAALYASQGDGTVDAGYAVVRERRSLALAAGVHDVVVGDLPLHLDAEALELSFPEGGARLISQRLLLAQGANAALAGLLGHTVDVLGSGGEVLANGILLRTGDGLLVRDPAGNTTLVRNYAAVRTTGTDFPIGTRLVLRIDARRSGRTAVVLGYPTSGLGWRAAYAATLQQGPTCRMQFASRASIANRSGRDWHDIRLSLIAGAPNFAKASAPRPMMMQASRLGASAESLPQQSTLADYRSYALPAAVDLPDGSVSQLPLYATRTVECERTALFETGNRWLPPQPMLNRNFDQPVSGAIVSTLKLTAFDSLPAGYLRVQSVDRHGIPQFIGEGRIDDTPKGSDASITLGTAFDLRAVRTRTAFSVDQAARTLDEAFRIDLGNTSDTKRTVTVREHPSRWRQWSLVSASSKPSRQTTDTLEFRVEVPAQGKAVLDYALRYRWTAEQTPQP